MISLIRSDLIDIKDIPEDLLIDGIHEPYREIIVSLAELEDYYRGFANDVGSTFGDIVHNCALIVIKKAMEDNAFDKVCYKK